ncbi:MAG: hypothetical protein ACPHK8_03465 [Thermoplasmatota archaeon]
MRTRRIGGMELSCMGAPSSMAQALYPLGVNVFLWDGAFERPGPCLLACRTDDLDAIPEGVDLVLWTGATDPATLHALDRFKTFGMAGDLGRVRLVEALHEAGVAAQQRGERADAHRLRALEVQISTGDAMAALSPTQPWKFGEHAPLQCAQDVGWAGFAVPDWGAYADPSWSEVLGADGAELQFLFARSVPGVHVVWVDAEHAEAAVTWAKKPFLDGEVNLMLGPGGPHG